MQYLSCSLLLLDFLSLLAFYDILIPSSVVFVHAYKCYTASSATYSLCLLPLGFLCSLAFYDILVLWSVVFDIFMKVLGYFSYCPPMCIGDLKQHCILFFLQSYMPVEMCSLNKAAECISILDIGEQASCDSKYSNWTLQIIYTI